MITKELLLKRKEELAKQREQLTASGNALLGAIQMIDILLAENEKEAEEKEDGKDASDGEDRGGNA